MENTFVTGEGGCLYPAKSLGCLQMRIPIDRRGTDPSQHHPYAMELKTSLNRYRYTIWLNIIISQEVYSGEIALKL